MSDRLGDALDRYLELVRHECAWAKGRFEDCFPKPQAQDARSLLRLSVERAEGGPEFQKLVSATAANGSLGPVAKDPPELLQDRIAIFFRRSGLYHRIFSGTHVAQGEEEALFTSAFRRKECAVTYLAPIDFLCLSSDALDFGDFQIRKFNPSELGRILGNEMNEIFFPHAHINTTWLNLYWFLVAGKGEPIKSAWEEVIDLDAPFPLQFSAYPDQIHSALRHLALYDWKGDVWTGASHPVVLFAIRVSDDLTETPATAPDLSKLAEDQIVDEDTGQHGSRYPAQGFDLDEAQTKQFRDFIQDTCRMDSHLHKHANCRGFLNVSLDFLTKGFFSVAGPEQLLWHMTAIDGLLGEKRSGLTNLIGTRLSRILEQDSASRKTCKTAFERLYDTRCEIVHGRALQVQVMAGQLQRARDLARATAVWMLHYLDHLAREMPTLAFESQSREGFLAALDERPGPGHILDSEISKALPPDFPAVSDWAR